MESLKQVNPNTYSSLPPKLENLRIASKEGDRLVSYIDETTGEKWYQLKQAARTQVLVSRLLKGIIPVSDIVVLEDHTGVNKMILSKEMDVTAGDVHTSSADRQADMLLLDYIFHDRDHGEAHNVSKNNSATNHFIFDFGESDQMFGEDHYFRHKSVDEEILSAQTDIVRAKLRQRLEQFLATVTAPDAVAFVTLILASISPTPVKGEYGSYITDTGLDAESFVKLLLQRTENAIKMLQTDNKTAQLGQTEPENHDDIMKL